MPLPSPENAKSKISKKPEFPTLRQMAELCGNYPPQAYDFLRCGLEFTAAKIHGKEMSPNQSRHVSGQQLCHGLREFALSRWGLLARMVLSRWNVTSTLDFGRIVFDLVGVGLLRTTENDTIADFRGIFDFAAFDSGYTIESKL